MRRTLRANRAGVSIRTDEREAIDDRRVPVSEESLPRFHLAVPVDDLGAAAVFYGQVLGCRKGRSAPQWTDWNFHGHQLVTHLVDHGVDSAKGRDSSAVSAADGGGGVEAHNPVDGHQVPVPHFGLILTIPAFHEMADRLKAAGTAFEIEPYLRFAGEVGEQWTMFFHDPAGNAIEVKAFADDSQVFAV